MKELGQRSISEWNHDIVMWTIIYLVILMVATAATIWLCKFLCAVVYTLLRFLVRNISWLLRALYGSRKGGVDRIEGQRTTTTNDNGRITTTRENYSNQPKTRGRSTSRATQPVGQAKQKRRVKPEHELDHKYDYDVTDLPERFL